MDTERENPHQFDMFDPSTEDETEVEQGEGPSHTVEKKGGAIVFKGLHKDDDSNYPAPDAWGSGKG